MLKQVIQKSLFFLFIFTFVFLITGCTLEKDMTGSQEQHPSVQSEEQADEQVGGSGESEQDEEETEQSETTDASDITKEKNKKESVELQSHSNSTKITNDHNEKKATSSTDNKKRSSSQTTKTTASQPTKNTTKEKQKQTQPEKKKNTVVYSIVISSNEVPLPPTEVEMTDGETVLDVLIRVTKEKGIQMDYRGGRGGTAYVEGIANVYEFDRGQGSGWMYRVNGIFPDRGAGTVPLYAGDRVEWLYTTNLGNDLGANLQPFR